MIYQCRFNKDPALYITQVELTINHALDIARLRDAWQETVNAVLLLRAKLSTDSALSFRKDAEVIWKVKDFSSLANTEAKYLAFKRSDMRQGIDLDAEVLHRFSVIKLGKEQFKLLWTHHHILFDATSFMSVINDFLRAYIGIPGTISRFSSEMLDPATCDSEYWEKQLNGIQGSEPLHLGCGGEAGLKSEAFQVSEAIGQQLGTSAQEAGITMNTVLQTAWGIVQAQYENRNDITFGSIRSYPREQVHNKLGLHINALPVRLVMHGKGSFMALAKNVRLQHQKHREKVTTSLEKIRQCAKLQGNDQLFVVAFDYKTQHIADLLSSDVRKVIPLDVDFVVNTHYQLMIEMVREQQGISGRITYDAAQHDKAHIIELISCYQRVLEQIAYNPEIPCHALHIVSKQDAQKQLAVWNATQKQLDAHEFLHSGLEKSAVLFPEKIAVISSRGKLSYQSLNQQANRIGYFLKSKNTQSNELVAIVMEKGWEQVVAAIAILKAGSAYLPISADFPRERINQLLRQGEVKFVLTQTEYLKSITWPEGVQAFAVDDSTQWQDQPTTNFEIHASCDDLAYVIFTSGSTGTPKGVMISHAAASNTIADINQRFHVTDKDAVLGLSELNFDLSVYDIFGVLGIGGQLILPSVEDRRDPAIWLDLIETHGVTLWDSVPALVKMLAEYGLSRRNAERAQKVCQSIRLILMSGDWIPLDLPGQARNLCGLDTQLMSLGGATEASIWSILYPIDTVDAQWKSIPYGKPMWNQQFYILDETLRIKPIGVPGELFIGGQGIAKGYWKNAEKTAASFIEHPTLGYIYKTGDMGKYRGDGNIEFMGRLDHQIKIRGYRVELGEIEFVLRAEKGVKDVVVRLFAPSPNHQQLVAYFTLDNLNCAISTEHLKSVTRENLPSYMVPSFFIQLDKFPLSANGKVDYKKLPAPQVESSTPEKIETVRPQGLLEQQLLEVWQGVFEIEKIGVTDNFFSLGGHSLKALELITILRESLVPEASIKDVFLYPTIRELGAHYENFNIKNIARKDQLSWTQENCFALSPAQERIWFLSKLVEDKPLYNISFCQKLSGSLDLDQCTKALQKLVRVHPYLRAVLISKGGEILQRIQDKITLDLKVLNQVCNEKTLDQLIEQQNDKPFNLFSGPLFRVMIITSSYETVIVVSAHHLIFDASSIDIFLRDLGRLYKGKEIAPHFIKLPTADQGILPKTLDYWRSVVGGQPVSLSLPAMKTRPNYFTYSGRTHYLQVPKDVVFAIRALSVRIGVTVSNLMLATLFILLKRYGQEHATPIGMPVTLRDDFVLQQMIGCFLNVLLLRVEPHSNESVSNFAKAVQTQFLESLTHNDIPYEMLVDELGVKRQTDRNALFQVMFSYQQQGVSDGDFAGHKMEHKPVFYDIAKFDLTTFVFDHSDDEISIAFEYCTSIFGADLIEAMLQDYVSLLACIGQDAESKIQTLLKVEMGIKFSEFGEDDVIQFPSNILVKEHSNEEVSNIVPAQYDIERKLCDLFSKILQVKSIQRNSSFFELGGHSMMATKLLINLEEEFDIKLPLRVIFESHIIKDLARVIFAVLNQQGNRVESVNSYEVGVL